MMAMALAARNARLGIYFPRRVLG
eukprot:COSAG05_NODE_19593_length_290_cov_0.921466_1_plen_23_part_10